jgi:hypothetical protein
MAAAALAATCAPPARVGTAGDGVKDPSNPLG